MAIEDKKNAFKDSDLEILTFSSAALLIKTLLFLLPTKIRRAFLFEMTLKALEELSILIKDLSQQVSLVNKLSVDLCVFSFLLQVIRVLSHVVQKSHGTVQWCYLLVQVFIVIKPFLSN